MNVRITTNVRLRRLLLILGLCMLIGLMVGSFPTDRAVAVESPTDFFVIPIGTGTGQVNYIQDASDPWGPISFCLLPDDSLAILDAGNQRIQVFSPSGSFLYSVSLAGIAISPVDIRWWGDGFALLEANTDPNSVVLLDVKGQIKQRIELPEDLADRSWGGLRIGSQGELGVLEAGTWMHLIAAAEGRVMLAPAMAERQTTIALEGGPRFTLSQGKADPARVQLVGSSNWVSLSPVSGVVSATPLASDTSGNTYFVMDYVKQSSPEEPISVDLVVVRLDSRFRQTGVARVDLAELAVVSTRMIDVSRTGDVYCMLPKANGVLVEKMELSEKLEDSQYSAPPPTPGILENDLGTVPAGTPGWTRADGDYLGYAYYALYWYCSEGAYTRSNENLNQYQAADNIKPRFMTSYNRTWKWTPYCWGGWDTITFFLDHVNQTSPGRDAGDVGSSYSNCAMNDYGSTTSYPCCGVDCSGLVTRLWGLNDYKRNTTMLASPSLSTQISLSQMLMGDVFDKPGVHVIWYRYPDGAGYNCYESTTWNSYDRVANTVRTSAHLAGYSCYRYKYWAQ